MKYDFEKLKNHKRYNVFYDLIQKMQETEECSLFLKFSEEILTHIIGMFIENTADIQHDIERLNQQERLSDKTLSGFQNVYNDIAKIKPYESLTNNQKEEILNGLKFICNWLLYRDSISYMVPIKNYGKGCVALDRLRDGGSNNTNNKENTYNKIAVEKKVDPPVQEESAHEKLVKKLVQERFVMQDKELEAHEEFLRDYMKGRSNISKKVAYFGVSVDNWKRQNHYRDYEFIKKQVEDELDWEWREIQESCCDMEDEEPPWDYDE